MPVPGWGCCRVLRSSSVFMDQSKDKQLSLQPVCAGRAENMYRSAKKNLHGRGWSEAVCELMRVDWSVGVNLMERNGFLLF